jgi:hypothetical protein
MENSNRNQINGHGVYLVVQDAPEELLRRVPGAWEHLGSVGLSLAPDCYRGSGATATEIEDFLKACKDMDLVVRVSTGHYATGGYIVRPRVVECDEDGQTLAEAVVYTAYHQAKAREVDLSDIVSSLNGWYNRGWVDHGGPDPESIRNIFERVKRLEKREMVLEQALQAARADKMALQNKLDAVVDLLIDDEETDSE